MSLDVVVVNYRTPEFLDRFVDSLLENPPDIDITLTIVDVDVEPHVTLCDWGFCRGRRIGLRGNVGYARACNRGAAWSTGDILALFNADVMVPKGSLDQCHDALLANPGWGVLGPRQIDSTGRIRHAGIFGTQAAPRHRGWNQADCGQYDDVEFAVTVSGSAYFIKRKVWDELTECTIYRQASERAEGAFLPTPHYYEETFCSYHATSHGYDVVYYGATTLIHEWHKASPIGGWAEQQMPKSRRIFRAACDAHGIPHD